MTTTFAVGALVKAREREWVVLPGSDRELLILRPIGGSEEEITGILLPLEKVEAATFDPPSPDDLGDFRSAQLLRDALRLKLRSSTGPFRSFAKIAVSPRPYQLVPLLMALDLDPVRLLIADDVGVGKTIEACLIAKEMLEQGTVRRSAVLCPPHLVHQWQRELADKFNIDAEPVLPSTAPRLERNLALGETIFDQYPHVVVSLDFIKTDRRRNEFVSRCPELVIVDEAHVCADPSGRKGQMQRYELVAGLAKDVDRHLVLVTATPHAGKEDPFRSLLGFLNPAFANLPSDLSSSALVRERKKLSKHLVQRRRGDIRAYLDAETAFPDREAKEAIYTLSLKQKEFFERVLRYCRESVRDTTGGQHRQRVRWWAALGLLRAVGSSPAAAAATLRERAKSAGTATLAEADALGRRAVLDLADDEGTEGIDVAPGAGSEDDGRSSVPPERRLRELARLADGLCGPDDNKLTRGIELVRGLLDEGFRPIVFCRFINTAEYLGAALTKELGKRVEVGVVTGNLPPAERELRIAALGSSAPKHVLVATDCIAEGVNLQEHFDAVVHYDLSWSPTRHEQREGRVDRFGQPRATVRVLTYFGQDNPIDGIILGVLLRKHRKIQSDLGIAIPVPADSNAVLEAILEGLLLRGAPDAQIEGQLELFEKDVVAPKRSKLHDAWDIAVDREKKSRTIFAQQRIDPSRVAAELRVTLDAVGSPQDVQRFVADAIRACEGSVTLQDDRLMCDLSECPPSLREIAVLTAGAKRFVASFDPSKAAGAVFLSRTHPLVDALAAYVLESAMDPEFAVGPVPAHRAGVIRTRTVKSRTTLLLVRYRFDLITLEHGETRRLLAEETASLAFEGAPTSPLWLADEVAEALYQAVPEANIGSDQARQFVARLVDSHDLLAHHLNQAATQRAQALLASHSGVRAGSRNKGIKFQVEAKRDPDLLGVYVFLPAK